MQCTWQTYVRHSPQVFLYNGCGIWNTTIRLIVVGFGRCARVWLPEGKARLLGVHCLVLNWYFISYSLQIGWSNSIQSLGDRPQKGSNWVSFHRAIVRSATLMYGLQNAVNHTAHKCKFKSYLSVQLMRCLVMLAIDSDDILMYHW